MSARGKGNVTIKRGTMPNLALAGKREDSTPASSGSDRGKRTPGRGGRGRGQRGGGRGGGFAKPALIQSEGIFSEGLSGEALKKAKRESESIRFATDSRNGREKKKDDKIEVEASKASWAGWDAEWQSDDEDEKEKLEDLIGDKGFISDLKKGDRLPIVLPAQDELQFENVVSRRVKKEVGTDEMDEDEKPVCKGEAPFTQLSRRAGNILGRVLDEPDDSLLFLQLPSVVNVLTGTREQEDAMEIDDNPASKDASLKPFSVPELPRGRNIGKLQVLKSGRVVLRVGDVTMDVTAAAPSDLRENVVLVETAKDDSNSGGILASKGGGVNAVYHMGSIRHHLLASLDWKDVQRNFTVKKEPVSPSKPSSKKNRSAGDKALREELRALEQESSSWAEQAERWASP